ncbi:MAG: cbb3-type cytochrome oxidase assembly protein CcoS [Proteobacteria bacterium]|nr:cbb3-type cytochrome oxidase assembly protein CcoS [Pseudomonadota bacterium]NOG61586.1 cbb3-type cytochrome oxidase assembly protein CcoS [Pseudomonadota bacterium]
MEVIFLLIIVSLGFITLLAVVLFWAIRSGQFDDMEKHGHSILMDKDDEVKPDKNESTD